MRRTMMLMALIAVLSFAPGNHIARGQAPAPVVRHLFRTEGLPLSGAFDVAHQVLDFAPGAATPVHTHPGLVVVTMLEGENTFRADGGEKVYRAGDSFVEMPGHVVQARNAGAGNMAVVASYVLPDEAPLSVPQPGDTTPLPRPTPRYQGRADGLAVSGPYDVAHQVLDFAPGAATPWHTHPGQVLVTVIEGTLTFWIDGSAKVYRAGDTFVEPAHHVAQASNASSARTSVMATFLLPKGAPLSQPAATPPALPATGADAAPVTFPETGYSLDGDFLAYWQAHGGLPVFGYPIDSARQVDGQVTQYLERTRFELHPANVAPYRVLLGRVGVEALQRQGRDWRTFAQAAPTAPHYFRETGHAIAYGPFWNYWASHGLEFDGRRGSSTAESLALFGYPISEAQMEVNASGTRVLTQWFERARFEYHPTNPTAYHVVLGRLGAEVWASPRR